MRYFFHNIYGDADELIASKPQDVEAVPFGWDEESETNRNRILSELNSSVSCLPSLIYWRNEYSYDSVDENNQPVTITVPAHWEEIRVAEIERPWTWDKIQDKQK